MEITAEKTQVNKGSLNNTVVLFIFIAVTTTVPQRHPSHSEADRSGRGKDRFTGLHSPEKGKASLQPCVWQVTLK